MSTCCGRNAVSRVLHRMANVFQVERDSDRDKPHVIYLQQIMEDRTTEPLVNLEPEVHIESFGMEHYLRTVFPLDTAAERLERKRHLRTFPCLLERDQRFRNKMFSCLP